MKKIFLIFLFALAFSSCEVEYNCYSPDFAYIEILDEGKNILEGVSFSADFDGKVLKDFSADLITRSADHPLNFGDIINGTKVYELSSLKFAENCNSKRKDLKDKLLINVSKEGYKSFSFVPEEKPGRIFYKSYIMEKE